MKTARNSLGPASTAGLWRATVSARLFSARPALTPNGPGPESGRILARLFPFSVVSREEPPTYYISYYSTMLWAVYAHIAEWQDSECPHSFSALLHAACRFALTLGTNSSRLPATCQVVTTGCQSAISDLANAMHINVILSRPPEARKAALTTAEARGIGRYQDQSDSAPFVARGQGTMASLLKPDLAATEGYSGYRRQSCSNWHGLLRIDVSKCSLEVWKRLGRRLAAPHTSRFNVLQSCYTLVEPDLLCSLPMEPNDPATATTEHDALGAGRTTPWAQLLLPGPRAPSVLAAA